MHHLSKKQIALLPVYNTIFTKEQLAVTAQFKGFYVIASKAIKAPFDFNSLTLSLSAKLNKNSAVLVESAVKTDKGWSGLYKLFYVSADYKKTFKPQKDDFASVEGDILFPKKSASAFKYQLTVLGKAKIDFLTAAFTKNGAKYDSSLALETLDLKDFEIPLKPISQMQYADKKLRTRICSPACLTMVLNYYGKKVSLEDALKGVYDEESAIYGTWPLNTAFAAQQGLGAGVVRCSSLAQAEGELYKGRPLIASIAYKEGQLKNAAVKSTQGHLVVICGFDAEGNVIVMDPAAKTEKEVRRVYDRKQFASAWIKNKKGLAYAIGE
ncbi:MAG: peptidase C39 family protein [Elusimicrobiaceae bacterium]|nr:peptidase C39 family protein [Elusimicrobiota bacterium]